MSESRTAFDPTKHLTKVSGRDYLEVKHRLVWLRDMYPDAQIETEMVQHQNQLAVFRAKVTLPPTPANRQTGEKYPVPFSASATGWGSEGSDDFGDYLEKAETKALGRALAALGFGTQFCGDYEFGADQQRVVDSPVNVRARTAPAAPERPPDARGGNGQDTRPRAPEGAYGGRQEATPRQIKYLYAVAREVGMSTEDLEGRSREAFGCDVASLSRRDISTLIEQIQSGRPAGPTGSDSFSGGDAPAPDRATVRNEPDQGPAPWEHDRGDVAVDAGDDEPITEQQIKRLKQLGWDRYGFDGLQVDDWVSTHLARPLSGLSRGQAEALITDWSTV